MPTTLLHSIHSDTPFFFEVKVINYPAAKASAAAGPGKPKPLR